MKGSRRNFLGVIASLPLIKYSTLPRRQVRIKRYGKLTNLYVSPEALEDIRNWGVNQIDVSTRKEIFANGWKEI